MKTKVFTLLCLVLTLVLSAACAPASTPTQPSPITAVQPTATTAAPAPISKTAQKVKLTFWNYWETTNGEAMQALVDKYNKARPEAEITNVFFPWADLRSKIVTAAAGGEAPDLAAVDMAWVPQLAEAGVLADLKPYIEKSGVDLNDFYPELLKIDRYGDKIYALPVSTNNLELFYNKDLFKAAGLDPEKPPKTWDELVEAAKKCADPAKGVWGMELYTKPRNEGMTWQFQVYLWQAGGDFLTDNYSKPAFNNAAGKQALQLWVDLIHKHKVASFEWDQFEKEKACMRMDGSWVVGIWNKQLPFDFGTAPMPIPPGGQPATNMGGEHLILFKTTPEKQQAAWEFVNWVTSTEPQTEWDIQTAFMPVRDSVAKSAEYRKWLTDTEPRLIPFADSQRYAHARPPITKYQQASDDFSVELEKALYGTVSVDEALKNAEAAVIAVLKD